MANFVSPNKIMIQIGLVLLVRPDTSDDTSQRCPSPRFRLRETRRTALRRRVHVGMPSEEKGARSRSVCTCLSVQSGASYLSQGFEMFWEVPPADWLIL